MWPFSSAPGGELTTSGTSELLRPLNQTRLLEEASPASQSLVNNPSLSGPDEAKDIQWTGYQGERLGMHPLLRIPLLMGASGFCGFTLGAAKGGPVAADRYRAENAHRFPTTRSGWYLYHKTKNYHMFVGSVTEGVKFGTKLMAWATLFAITEEMIDRSRARLFARREEDEDRVSGQRDAVSTAMAALSVAGVYSWKSGFDHFAAGRMAKMALKYSLIYGIVQDAAASVRGSRPSYVDWLLRRTFGYSPSAETV